MANFIGRLTINLSLFAFSDHSKNNNRSSTKSISKSPRIFEPSGVIGLRIVAAMNEFDRNHNSSLSVTAASPRSMPIPIITVSNASPDKFGGGRPNSEEEMELSEEYTCVISHNGNTIVKKREYFDDDDDDLAKRYESSVSRSVSSKAFSAYPQPSAATSFAGDVAAMATAFQREYFLNSCNLCKKRLQGLDIFMYRGEKAFCSVECRHKHIAIDEHRERCGSGVMEQFGYSVSPCSSSPMQFLAGVAAA